MVKMVALKKTPAERKAEESAMDERHEELQEPEGIEVHLENHHLKKFGLDKPLPSGHEIEIHAKGHVTASHSGEEGGIERNHMRIKITHMSMDHEPVEEERKTGLRNELSKNMKESEAKRG